MIQGELQDRIVRLCKTGPKSSAEIFRDIRRELAVAAAEETVTVWEVIGALRALEAAKRIRELKKRPPQRSGLSVYRYYDVLDARERKGGSKC
jgi:tRNA A37 threonylcarbamoyladenosine synthetase subunit TsaC/SUA5/YrdC